jgi:hypothetical protein
MLLGTGALASHQARAATPSTGTISTTSPSLTWTGQFFAAGFNADPSQCPPNLDPQNIQCDHFYLTLNIAPDFWSTHSGFVLVTITWSSGSNDFDLFVYRQSDGQLVGSSTLGGGETEEQVMLQSPVPGTYEVRTVPFLVIASGYSGSAQLIFSNTPPVQNPSFPTGGIGFGSATVVDPQRTEGEPLVHIDQSGNVWNTGPWGLSTGQSFLSKSTDGGQKFHVVSSLELRPNPSIAGGGDSDVITDDQGNAYFSDLEAASVLVGVSNDGGNTWRTNNLAAQIPGDDRQWLAVDNGQTPFAKDNTIFLAYRQIPLGSQVLSSPGSTGVGDPLGGLVFQNAATTTTVGHGAPCGRLTFDPVKRMLYLPCLLSDRVNIARASVAPGQRMGLAFSSVTTPPSPGRAVGHLFSSVTVDKAGNLYAVWVDTNNNNVYLSVSQDTGTTWSAPLQVNGDPANTNVMPWAVAGAPGIVDIVFYGTAVRGDPNTFPSWYNNRQTATSVKWFPYFVQVQNALASTPTIYMVQASEHPTDYGQLCTQGLECTVTGGDRTLSDYFSVALDQNGAAHIVIDDLTNQHHGAALFELTQTTGPSAFGMILGGTSSNTATGATDPAGDAQVPHYLPGGPGPNQPVLDLLGVQLSQPDPAHLTLTLKLASLASLVPPPGADGIVWLTRWQFLSTGDGGEESYRIFYMGANVTGGLVQSFFAGTGLSGSASGIPGDGCITTSPQNCKLVLYPAEKVETGSINTSTGNITITAPLGDIGSPITGDTLFSVTALSFGFVRGDPLLIDADAARSFDYVLGSTILPTNCPLGTTCKVTGGGYIFVDPQQDHGSFSIELTVDSSGRVHGKTDYLDHAINMTFRTALITSVNFSGNTATFKGTGTANGLETSFAISVQDNDASGFGTDTFSIKLETGYSKSGPLAGGDIQVH